MVGPAAKDELKFSTEVPGALCVMTTGTVMMPTWCVDRWAVVLQSRLWAVPDLGGGEATSGWMMSPAPDASPHWPGVVTVVTGAITVVTKKMLGWFVEVSQSI